MSEETMDALNANTLIGFTAERGNAWHAREGAGNHFKGAVPLKRVKELLDFEVHTLPVQVTVPGVGTVDYAERGRTRKAYVRVVDGQAVGIGLAGESRAEHGYVDWLVKGPGSILDDTLAIGQAGLLRNGAQAWVSVETPETVKTAQGEAFRPQLLCCSSYDGSLASTFKWVFTRVVCDNTLTAGLGETGAAFRTKHTKNSTLDIPSAREALNVLHEQSKAFTEEIGRMIDTPVSDSQWEAFLAAHIPLPEVKETKSDSLGRGYTMAVNKQDAFRLLWNKDPRVAPYTGTLWGVVQADNTWRQHMSKIAGNKGSAARFERSLSLVLAGKEDESTALVLANARKVLA